VPNNPEKGHFVYILRCRGNRLYTGYAVDVQARYAKHLAGTAAHFTKAFPPEELLCFIPVETRSLGLRLEAAIKALSKTQKERIIGEIRNGNLPEIGEYIDLT